MRLERSREAGRSLMVLQQDILGLGYEFIFGKSRTGTRLKKRPCHSSASLPPDQRKGGPILLWTTFPATGSRFSQCWIKRRHAPDARQQPGFATQGLLPPHAAFSNRNRDSP